MDELFKSFNTPTSAIVAYAFSIGWNQYKIEKLPQILKKIKMQNIERKKACK